MLSYRHAFHTGNHADVFKHYILSTVLDYFNQKSNPYWVVDTHAGAGMYALKDGFSQKNAEYENGIARLTDVPNLPGSLQQYLNCIQAFNKAGELDFYPGSPKIADYFVRESDKLRLFELHPSDYDLLSENFRRAGRKTKVSKEDGFKALKAILPPPTKRAVVLIDPPYEVKEDYARVVESIKESLKRFSTGTYLIWYPLLQTDLPFDMVDELATCMPDNWLNASLSVEHPHADGFGMYGSGVFVINPPYTLADTLRESMPVLSDHLGMDDGVNITLDYNIA